MKSNYDVIVVGAGLTGLTAAYRCAQQNQKVLVLEARDRVGGRTYSKTESPYGVPGVFDYGAHFIGDEPYQASVWDLSELESAGTVTTDVSGTSFLPALVIPIPLIARTQTKACKALADQLQLFIDSGNENT